ncbi:hypothetical protein MRB53_014975 [Persea americana]|uniref:Uncharacterized protein n=1 Tax=Persea americana TaxID=3435 RepID=A0ACC2KCB2_PERAE|nr:hypothetical protein MRB53_014975 [Persea americana]|eukprot:TRINITY_DN7110_c0_g1_i3.p1 TRINITY_DN7110_c0_g1~~TRINITY_DN7110_c0_g1_i3.p1  ORF type:complete len:244 (-),score=55.41 TRINITY_DN7110_c0_g1_i3:368-1099(-)
MEMMLQRWVCGSQCHQHKLWVEKSSQFIRPKARKLVVSSSSSTPSRLLSRSKRTLGLSLLIWVCSPIPSFLIAMPQTQQPELLDRYTDTKEGFSLLIPSSWVKVEKAGATVLFEDASSRGNNVGVVVSPVRLSSLKDFGSPQFVADKLIQAEKRKESTKEAEVIAVAERSGDGVLPVYEFEYKVDSTRGGMKRIFSAAFVASKKLYLLNISYSDRPENPIDPQTRLLLEKVLHSFDMASSSTT